MTVRTAFRESAVASRLRCLYTLSKHAVRDSRIAGWSPDPPTLSPRVVRHSRLYTLASTTGTYVEHSWLYRWLTAEPEQDVIVIDLRETLTVGPWLRLIQRTLEWLLPAALSSALFRTCRRIHGIVTTRPVQLASILLAFVAVLVLSIAARLGDPSPALAGVGVLLAVLAVAGSRVTWTYEELRETRGYQLLADAFEPPEPPEPAIRERNEQMSDNQPADDGDAKR